MNSSDSAEAIVKLSLEGMEVALKIAGTGAKNIAIMLYTIMKDNQQLAKKLKDFQDYRNTNLIVQSHIHPFFF